jgi:SSS family solute:Na+ symporter
LPLRLSRILTSALGITVILAALLVPVLGNNVIEIINVIAGTSLGMLLAVYLLGLFVPRANLAGVLAGLAAGLICLASVWGRVPNWWYGAFTIVPTFIVGAVASLLFAPPPESMLKDTLLWKPGLGT